MSFDNIPVCFLSIFTKSHLVGLLPEHVVVQHRLLNRLPVPLADNLIEFLMQMDILVDLSVCDNDLGGLLPAGDRNPVDIFRQRLQLRVFREADDLVVEDAVRLRDLLYIQLLRTDGLFEIPECGAEASQFFLLRSPADQDIERPDINGPAQIDKVLPARILQNNAVKDG